MDGIKAIETEYNGHKFRSRLEARWAYFFDLMSIDYEYEPEGIVLSDGTKYLPDFYLPQFYSYFEVKRKSISKEEYDAAIKKISDGKNRDKWSGIICFGDPYDHNMLIFCQETDDDGGGSYEGRGVFGLYPETDEPMIFIWNDTKERFFYDSFTLMRRIPIETDINHEYLENPFVSQKVIDAEKAARQARFEHGEKPIIY